MTPQDRTDRSDRSTSRTVHTSGNSQNDSTLISVAVTDHLSTATDTEADIQKLDIAEALSDASLAACSPRLPADLDSNDGAGTSASAHSESLDVLSSQTGQPEASSVASVSSVIVESSCGTIVPSNVDEGDSSLTSVATVHNQTATCDTVSRSVGVAPSRLLYTPINVASGTALNALVVLPVETELLPTTAVKGDLTSK